MTTDDERRRVAASLRHIASTGGGELGTAACNMCEAIGEYDYPLWSDAHLLFERIADLIDPDIIPDKPDETGRPLSDPEIDRERLLAIATMMAADSVRSVKKGISVSPVYILHAARNIAEACGETFASIRNRDLTKWGTSIVPKETIADRDALLALADEIDRKSDDGTVNPDPMKPIASSLDLLGYARRIRKAVGE